MQGRDDVAAFIAGFAGDDRFIVDYLVGEVLQRQPDASGSSCCETSVLDRLTGSLCDAVTGERDGGKATLEALDRANLFLIPLDDRREWYRYHHLFADVLRARLLDEDPDAGRRSCIAGRATGSTSTASRPRRSRTRSAGGDFDRAASLVELAAPAMRQTRQDATLRALARSHPRRRSSATRPVLAIGFVGARDGDRRPRPRRRPCSTTSSEWLALTADTRPRA